MTDQHRKQKLFTDHDKLSVIFFSHKAAYLSFYLFLLICQHPVRVAVQFTHSDVHILLLLHSCNKSGFCSRSKSPHLTAKAICESFFGFSLQHETFGFSSNPFVVLHQTQHHSQQPWSALQHPQQWEAVHQPQPQTAATPLRNRKKQRQKWKPEVTSLQPLLSQFW